MDVDKAWEILKPYKFKVYHGAIVIPDNLKEPKDLNEALNYLVGEWDYEVLTKHDYKSHKRTQRLLKICDKVYNICKKLLGV